MGKAEQLAGGADLRSFEMKLCRAKAHIDAVKKAVEGWLQSDAYTLRAYVEPETGDHVLRAKINEALDPRWALVVGDAVHNLRSALDHIAYQLALDGYEAHNAGRAIPRAHQRRIMFPIVAVSNDSRMTVEKFYAQGIKGQLRYIADDSRDAIEALQPYKRRPSDPCSDPLWVVNELDVIDKHRKLNPTAIASPLDNLGVVDHLASIKHLAVYGGTVKDGDELMRWSGGGTQMDPDRYFSRQIALAEGPQVAQETDLLTVLGVCYADILQDVVPALEPWL